MAQELVMMTPASSASMPEEPLKRRETDTKRRPRGRRARISRRGSGVSGLGPSRAVYGFSKSYDMVTGRSNSLEDCNSWRNTAISVVRRHNP